MIFGHNKCNLWLWGQKPYLRKISPKFLQTVPLKIIQLNNCNANYWIIVKALHFTLGIHEFCIEIELIFRLIGCESANVTSSKPGDQKEDHQKQINTKYCKLMIFNQNQC